MLLPRPLLSAHLLLAPSLCPTMASWRVHQHPLQTHEGEGLSAQGTVGDSEAAGDTSALHLRPQGADDDDDGIM